MTNRELQVFLTEHNLTKEEFADILGVSKSGVTHWLTGIRDISKPVARLCKLFTKYPELMREFREP